MFSALSSFIWGTTEEDNANSETKLQAEGHTDEHVELENEWIYIQPKGKYSIALYLNCCTTFILFVKALLKNHILRT